MSRAHVFLKFLITVNMHKKGKLKETRPLNDHYKLTLLRELVDLMRHSYDNEYWRGRT